MFEFIKKKVPPVYVIAWLPEAGINIVEITDKEKWAKETTDDGYVRWKRLDGIYKDYAVYGDEDIFCKPYKTQLRCFLGPVDKEFDSITDALSYDFTDFPQRVPAEGAFIAYKFVKTEKIRFCSGVSFRNPEIERIIYAVAKLEIPADAKRLSLLGRNENRADKAKVLEITRFDGKKVSVAFSPIWGIVDGNILKYSVGSMVYADSFNPYRICCGGGIYFCMTKQEAINYSKKGYLYIGDQWHTYGT